MFLIRMDRVLWQKNGKTSCPYSKWSKNGKQKAQLLFLRLMEPKIPPKVQMAPLNLKTSPLIKNEKVKIENLTITIKENLIILFLKHLQKQKNKKDHIKEAKVR